MLYSLFMDSIEICRGLSSAVSRFWLKKCIMLESMHNKLLCLSTHKWRASGYTIQNRRNKEKEKQNQIRFAFVRIRSNQINRFHFDKGTSDIHDIVFAFLHCNNFGEGFSFRIVKM